MEFLACTMGTQSTPQADRYPCDPTISSIAHFEGQIEVQLDRWRNTVSLESITA